MVRAVTAQDSGRIIELLQQLWPEKGTEHEKMAQVLEEHVDGPGFWIYGYEDDGVLLGIITASFRWALYYEGEVAIIEDLIVDEVHRGKGIGRKLVRFAEDRIAEDNEVKAIELSSDFHREGAHEFREQCGYSKVAFSSE
jgi:GNAT superfamily N-acetyltransferase